MGKALRIDVHPRAIQLAELIDSGFRDFDDLHPRDKEILFQTHNNGIDISSLVSQEELRVYELERKTQTADSTAEKIAATIGLRIHDTRKRLGV